MKLTLDWNCIIEVENDGPQSKYVGALIELHRSHKCEVALLATSASENTRSKRFPGSASEFTERVRRLNWSDLPVVPMPAVIGLTYWDFCYWIDDGNKFERETGAIWDVIASKVACDPVDHFDGPDALTDEMIQSESLTKWRNSWCDVLSAYSHIEANRDVFVTLNTRDFQKHAAKLKSLGMNHICDPAGALEFVV
ncbi:hypothetical protein [Litoreibacter arenae]|uniref:hypothetical protein n=1 Tax=Litoreibacter arenae TaxID=491388 RepID=UPI000592F24B|nr:hypothetical protein [Litoreibacter arenae]